VFKFDDTGNRSKWDKPLLKAPSLGTGLQTERTRPATPITTPAPRSSNALLVVKTLLTAVGADPLAVDPIEWRWCGTARRELTSAKWKSLIQGYAFAGSDDAPEQTMLPCVEGPRIRRNIANHLKLGLLATKNLDILSISRAVQITSLIPGVGGRGGKGLGCDFQPHSCTEPGISTYATESRHLSRASNFHPVNEVASPVCFYLLPKAELGLYSVVVRKR
jgi:hypothetical protein